MKKTILITGSTDGIGKLTAIKLSRNGDEIYLHGRNPNKLAKVIEEVKNISGNENIKGFVSDFSDIQDVIAKGKSIGQDLDHIDVLINNAGVFKSPTTYNETGLDMRMMVNYIAPYIFTNELIPLLLKSDQPRLINLSSAAQAHVSDDILMGKRKGSENDTYAQSKLALTMWSMDLAKRYPQIMVIPVNPGSLLNTNMVKEAYGRFWSSADKGADILYNLATKNEYISRSGEYFDNDAGQFGDAHADAYDEAKIKHLIKVTEDIISR